MAARLIRRSRRGDVPLAATRRFYGGERVVEAHNPCRALPPSAPLRKASAANRGRFDQCGSMTGNCVVTSPTWAGSAFWMTVLDAGCTACQSLVGPGTVRTGALASITIVVDEVGAGIAMVVGDMVWMVVDTGAAAMLGMGVDGWLGVQAIIWGWFIMAG
jgi:hypothetical protein